MLYPSINKIRKKADSRYTLVILAAKRARDIIDGKPALAMDSVNRPVSIAAHEIAEDLITYDRSGQKASPEAYVSDEEMDGEVLVEESNDASDETIEAIVEVTAEEDAPTEDAPAEDVSSAATEDAPAEE